MQDPDFDPYLPPRAPIGFAKPMPSGKDSVEGSPWLTIWTRPRGTIRAIVDTDPTRSVLLLAMIYGISSTLSRSMQRSPGDYLSLSVLLILALAGGSLSGIIINYLMAALVRWTGSWIGGVASVIECRAALAWGAVPMAVNLVLMLGLIAIFGQDLFKSGGLDDVGMTKGAVLFGSRAGPGRHRNLGDRHDHQDGRGGPSLLILEVAGGLRPGAPRDLLRHRPHHLRDRRGIPLVIDLGPCSAPGTCPVDSRPPRHDADMKLYLSTKPTRCRISTASAPELLGRQEVRGCASVGRSDEYCSTPGPRRRPWSA